jgi:predicted metal-dependent hydrolase
VIVARRLQQNFADGFIAEAVEALWEPWMRHADQALEDEALLLIIQQELAKRCKKSKTRGRKSTPAEVILRMLLLKHLRDWSLRNADAGGARQPGLSRIHADRR